MAHAYLILCTFLVFISLHGKTVFASESDDDSFLSSEANNQRKKHEIQIDEQTLDVLNLLYDKIDTDHNGKCTPVELRDWIRYVQRKYVRDGVEVAWKDNKYLVNGVLTWDGYVAKRFGAWAIVEDTEMEVDSEESRKEKGFNYKAALMKDRRRWKLADVDGDDKLSKREYTDFAYPEDSPRLRSLVVDETMEDLDLDGDGKLSLEEFIADYDKVELEREYDHKPAWLDGDMEHFRKNMDKNGDGFVDKTEMGSYLTPDMEHHANLEVKYIFQFTDFDKSNYLDKAEFLKKAELITRSQVTNHGDVILKHDEF